MNLLSSPDVSRPDAGCALAALRGTLSGLLSKELRLRADEVRTDRPFTEYGLDSMAALTIAGELEERYAIELPATLLWDCPTIDHLSQRMHAMLSTRGPQDVCRAGR